MLQTVQKAAEVLNLFSCEHPEWGISELAKVLTFPKSSTAVVGAARQVSESLGYIPAKWNGKKKSAAL